MPLFSPNEALSRSFIPSPPELMRADEAYQAIYPLLMKSLSDRDRVARALQPELDSTRQALDLALDINLRYLWNQDDAGWHDMAVLPIVSVVELNGRLKDPRYSTASSVTALVTGKLPLNNFFWGYAGPCYAAVWLSHYEALVIGQKFVRVENDYRLEEILALLLYCCPGKPAWKKVDVFYQATVDRSLPVADTIESIILNRVGIASDDPTQALSEEQLRVMCAAAGLPSETTSLTVRNWRRGIAKVPLRIGRSLSVIRRNTKRGARWREVEERITRETSSLALKFAFSSESCDCRVDEEQLGSLTMQARPVAQALTSQRQHWAMIGIHAAALASKLTNH